MSPTKTSRRKRRKGKHAKITSNTKLSDLKLEQEKHWHCKSEARLCSMILTLDRELKMIMPFHMKAPWSVSDELRKSFDDGKKLGQSKPC